MAKYKKKSKLKSKDEYGLGGLIGTGIGAIGGTFLGNPLFGAQVGGMIGEGIDQIGEANQQKEAMKRLAEKNKIANRTTATGSLGEMRHGGKVSYKGGGTLQSIGQDAVKFKGASHENGGIKLDQQTEVEGGETMDNIQGSDYIFSKQLKVPGTKKSFAQVHEALIENGAGEQEITELSNLQEEISGRNKSPKTSGGYDFNIVGKNRYGGKLKRKYGRK